MTEQGQRKNINILIVLFTDGHFPELFRFARFIKATGVYEPLVFWTYDHTKPEYIRACRDESICFSGIPEFRVRCMEIYPSTVETRTATVPAGLVMPTGLRTKMRLWLESLPTWISSPLLRFVRYVITVPDAIRVSTLKIRFSTSYIRKNQCCLVALAEDNAGYHTAEWIRGAHHAGTPCLILPYTIANAKEPAEALFHNARHGIASFWNRLVATFYPKWVHVHE